MRVGMERLVWAIAHATDVDYIVVVRKRMYLAFDEENTLSPHTALFLIVKYE